MQLEANRGCGKHAWVFKTSKKQNHSSRELGLGSNWVEPVRLMGMGMGQKYGAG